MVGAHRVNYIYGSAKYKGRKQEELLARGPDLAISVLIFGLRGNKQLRELACQFYTT